MYISSAKIYLQWNLYLPYNNEREMCTFQVLKYIYNGIYNSISFTYVDSNKILNINTLLICLLREKNRIYFKNFD